MRDFSGLPQPFGRAEAMTAGFTLRNVERAAASGPLTRLAPSLYAVRAAWEPLPPWVRHAHLARAAVRLTPDAMVSHLSLPVLMGLPHPAYPVSKVSMTLLDDGRTSRADEWRQFHPGRTPPGQVIVRGRRAHLTPTRTVVDCARDLHPRDALAIMDAALRAGLTTRSRLREMRRHQRRWPGIAAVDTLLRIADPLRENWLESASAWAVHASGLPAGVPQVTVLDSMGRFVARVDALWPELGVVGEADGRGKYEIGAGSAEDADVISIMRKAVHEQREREDRLRDLGLVVCRWGQSEAMAISPLADRLQSAFQRADPARVSARYKCSCCRRDLTDCAGATQVPLIGA
ncbi:hypothetical protein ACOCJ5_10405 [Knoellia sp. CPCC 206450]|uniref:hypothetical protein n=1 Tax=Knoellia tibetensis TaxID=3404798 RepID=UPI003B42B7D4